MNTAELLESISAQLGASGGVAKTFLRTLARTIAATYTLLYKYIGFGTLQGFVKFASAEPTLINGRLLTPLHEWGELVGAGLPSPATQAELILAVTVDSTGGSIPSGTQLVHTATGVSYLTTTVVLLDAPTVSIRARAAGDQAGGNGSGSVGNVAVGRVLSFTNPLPNVQRDCVVTGQSVVGSDAEDPEVYRQRVINFFRQRPQGGALSDYRQWAEEPAGIDRAYPYTSGTAPGQVDVYVRASVSSSGDPDGVPSPAQLEEVQKSIEADAGGLASRRPVGVLVSVKPISIVEFTLQVHGLTAPDLVSTQLAISQAATSFFKSLEPYISGLDSPPRRDRITSANVAGVVSRVVGDNGGVFIGVTVITSSIPVVTYTLAPGQIPKLTGVSYG